MTPDGSLPISWGRLPACHLLLLFWFSALSLSGASESEKRESEEQAVWKPAPPGAEI
jgi:hypothetical protein